MSLNCLLVAAAFTFQADKPFVSAGGGFSINLPAKPIQQSIKVPSAIGEIAVTLYQTKADGLEYTLSFNDYPDAILKADINQVLEGVAKGVIQGGKGKMTLIKPTKLGDIPGREVEFNTTVNGKEMTGHARLFIQKTRLYQIIVVGEAGKLNDKTVDTFFDSLKIEPLKPGAKPDAPANTSSVPYTPGKPLVSKPGKFSIAMPGQAAEQVRDIPTPGGNSELHLFILEQGNMAYFVSYNDYPVGVVIENTDELLEAACAGSIQTAKGELKSKSDIKLGNLPGKEINYTIPLPGGKSANGRSKLYLKGNRLYQVLVLSAGDEVNSPASKNYFNSFKVTDGK
jgi:hypothetical protein